MQQPNKFKHAIHANTNKQKHILTNKENIGKQHKHHIQRAKPKQQTNKQTNKQTNRHTNTQTNKQTSKQASYQTHKPLTQHTNKQKTHTHTITHTHKQT